jgi:hypothetical protein
MFGAKWPYVGLPKAQKRGPVVETSELTGAPARRSSELLALPPGLAGWVTCCVSVLGVWYGVASPVV